MATKPEEVMSYGARYIPGSWLYRWWAATVQGEYFLERIYARNRSVNRNAWMREVAAFTGGFAADI